MADEKEVVEKTIAEDLVVTKYKLAGEITNRTLKSVIDLCSEGASVREICSKGDALILEETGKVYKKEKELKKGIAFPTCLSVNNCVCHFSPTKNDQDYVLNDGDVVKVDLGAHIDGFIAVAAHTIVVGATPDNKVTGRKADTVLAARWASQAALRLLKPGNGNYAVTEAVQKVAEAYQCKPIEGMLSRQLKQFKIDGEKTIIQNPNEAQRKEHEKCDFEVHEVYVIDVIVSSGEGVGKEKDTKVSIYKKTDENYQVKFKASRAFLSEVKTKHGNVPFNLRHFEEETLVRKVVNDFLLSEAATRRIIGSLHRFAQHPAGRVIGGHEVKPHQYPFVVSLFLLDSGHNCGGVILSERWVLTAGHCIHDRGTDEYLIVAGKHDIENYEDGEQAVYAGKFIVHEEFSPYEIGPNDIGLIYLKDPFVFSDTVGPIALPEDGVIPEGWATIIGWGSIALTLDAEFPPKLRAAEVEILDNDICAKYLTEVNFDERNLCTGPLEETAGHCDGDSGTGLVQNVTGVPTVVGIASFAYRPCGSANIPPALTRVSYYISWIKEKMEQNS